MGNPVNVRIKPGVLRIAPLGSTEPADLLEAWPAAWEELGYTKEGSNFMFEQTFEDVEVAEELEPVAIVQTKRGSNINFSLAELTAENMSRALNGGTVVTAGGLVTFEPPPAGEATYVMIGWEADDGLERWIWRKCLNVGSIDIARKKGAESAAIPVQFRSVKPVGEAPWVQMHSEDYAELGS